LKRFLGRKAVSGASIVIYTAMLKPRRSCPRYGMLEPEEDENDNAVGLVYWYTPYTANRPELKPTASRQWKSKAMDSIGATENYFVIG